MPSPPCAEAYFPQRLRAPFDGGALGFDGAGLGVMVPFRLVAACALAIACSRRCRSLRSPISRNFLLRRGGYPEPPGDDSEILNLEGLLLALCGHRRYTAKCPLLSEEQTSAPCLAPSR